MPNRLTNFKYDIEEMFTVNQLRKVYWPKFEHYFGEWACCPPCFDVSLNLTNLSISVQLINTKVLL